MKSALIIISMLIGLLCGGTVWAQDPTTTNGHLFTSTPQPAIDTNSASDGVEDARVPAQARRPVILNFDELPRRPWLPYSCIPPFAVATVSHGILTIDSPASNCYEYDLWNPEGIWHHYVSNKRGWVIEASLQVDPSTINIPFFDGAVLIWAHDHTNLLIFGFNTDQIFLTYPEQVAFAMDTTDSFHVYRIESKGKRVRVYVDGHLAIDHTLTVTGAGSNVLTFGDGNGFLGKTSLTRWDYFSYNVFPDPPLSD